MDHEGPVEIAMFILTYDLQRINAIIMPLHTLYFLTTPNIAS